METTAIFDASRRYRYSLRRWWSKSERNLLGFILLNPSSADEKTNDPTIRRCISLARSWEFAGIVVVNLFAHRTKDPVVLKQVKAPIGPENDYHIRLCAMETERLVIGWGNHGVHNDRGLEVLKLLDSFELWCLGRNKNGQPKHPLYVSRECSLMRFKRN